MQVARAPAPLYTDKVGSRLILLPGASRLTPRRFTSVSARSMSIDDQAAAGGLYNVEVHSNEPGMRCTVEQVMLENAKEHCLLIVARGLSHSSFSVTAYFDELAHTSIGRHLIVSKSVSSTQQILSACNTSLPRGTIFVTDIQSQGKGRGNNHWVSHAGCLMFSFTDTFRDGRSLPCVQYLVSIALIEAVKSYVATLDPGDTYLAQLSELKIKWPNDLYFGNEKIGGVLCNSNFENGEYFMTIGVGFNVSNEGPGINLANIIGCRGDVDMMSRERLLVHFLEKYQERRHSFCIFGFESLKVQYLQNWLHSDQPVVLQETVCGVVVDIDLVIKGLTNAGLLLAEDSFGQKYELSPDGNGFDFFRGLIRRKYHE